MEANNARQFDLVLGINLYRTVPVQETRRLVTDISQVRAECDIDAATHCWIWRGRTERGLPVIYSIAPRALDKRTLKATQAVWTIAHGQQPPAGRVVYKTCFVKACCNPAHMKCVTRPEFLQAIKRSGVWKGKQVESRMDSLRKAWATSGRQVPQETVDAVRADTGSLREIARRHGISVSAAGFYRSGKRRATSQHQSEHGLAPNGDRASLQTIGVEP